MNSIEIKSATAFLLDLTDFMRSASKNKPETEFNKGINKMIEDYIKCYQITQLQKFELSEYKNKQRKSPGTSDNSLDLNQAQGGRMARNDLPAETNDNIKLSTILFIIIGVLLLILFIIFMIYLFHNSSNPEQSKGRQLLNSPFTSQNKISPVNKDLLSRSYKQLPRLTNNIIRI